jgi:maltooligosyltrehalose trehalohydrolase
MAVTKIDRRTLGVNYEAGRAEICVWAPDCAAVSLELAGGEALLLSRQPFGYWQLSTDELQPGMNYRFLLDEQPVPDITSLSQPDGVHGYSCAYDLRAQQWHDQHWDNPPLKDYILYELHTGTFTAEGTFAAISKKLNYLRELGVTAIEMMPVAQFPGERNWGYDGVFPFAVQNSYGGPSGLRDLVDACHQQGIAVVLDVVYNHFGPEGNYLSQYGPYFTGKYQTPWGDAVNFDDAGSDQVRRLFIENVMMWFRDFHIDALRLDAVHAIKDFSPKHILREIKEHVNELMTATGKTHHLIVECDLNDKRFINPLGQKGYGMDAQWIDEFHHALRVSAGGARDGYYADFEPVVSLAAAYQHAYVYHGQYSAQRQKTFGTLTDNPGEQFVVFSQNHDQVGNRMLGERSSQLFSTEMQKLMVGAVLVSPFIPLLFMGEEKAETNPFLYFISHTDPKLVRAVQQGRKKEFAAFHAEGEAPDPQAVATFEKSKIEWGNLSEGPASDRLRYYQALITLRKTNPALKVPDRDKLVVEQAADKGVIVLRRWQDDQELFCLLNFSGNAATIPCPRGVRSAVKIFDSADPEWGGSKSSPAIIRSEMDVRIEPQSLLIYTQSHV